MNRVAPPDVHGMGVNLAVIRDILGIHFKENRILEIIRNYN